MALPELSEMGLEVFSASLVSLPLSTSDLGPEIFSLGWQRLGMPNDGDSCCNVFPRQGCRTLEVPGVVVLLSFPSLTASGDRLDYFG